VVEGNFIGTNATGNAALPNSGNGIVIASGANGNTIGGTTSATRNVISANMGHGVLIQGSSGNVVQGNYIGTNVTGTVGLGNANSGVAVSGGSNNTIGGTDTNAPGAPLAGAGNLISGQTNFGTAGIALIGSSGNVIQGNYVGTDVTGSHALANMFGIVVRSGAAANQIGTTGLSDYGDRNVLSGNLQTGISLAFAGTNQNVVAGNDIGTDATGTHAVGNGVDNAVAGVVIGWTAQNNQIGGLGPLANTLPNTIAFNGGPGVWVISDSTTGDNTTGNSIRDNSIHDNAGLGIDLGGDYDLSTLTSVPGPDGVTLNDSEGHAAPNNPNNFQDFPILTSAITNKGGVTIIAGSFNSGTVNGAPFEPNTNITVDFHANATPGHPFTDPKTGTTHAYGEGQIYLGSQTYKTNPNGTFTIAAFKPAVTVPVGYSITATATDPAGDTSEFGPDVLVTLPQNASHGMAQMVASSVSGSGASAGALVPEDLGVYVDNRNGDLTADELARIQDAVAAVDTVTAPYGATIALVTDPALADVTLTMDTTSAVGGYAAGVLGCYSTGTITLIQGWNWYAGSDPTQISASQYDFETTLIHELGHSLGLGESSDPTSAMSGTLATGTVIRTLTTADLNIPYDEQGPDPQRAVGASSVATGSDPVRVSGRDPVFTTLEAERRPGPSTGPVAGPVRSEVGVSVPAAVRAEALPRMVVSPAAGTADSGRAPLSSIWGEDGSATPDAVAIPDAGPGPWDNRSATEPSPVFPSESDHGTVRALPTSSGEGLPFPMPESDPAETLWPSLCDACFAESNGETGAGPGESLAWAAAVVALGFVLPDPRATPTDERRPSRWLLRG
jgi:parallel beta-helix repeat protein